MILLSLASFVLILGAGRLSMLARRIVSVVVVLVGATLVLIGALDGGEARRVLAGAALMSAGSAGLLVRAVPARLAMGFLTVIGLPWVLVLWMGVRLTMADVGVPAAREALLIPAGILILYVALILEEAATRDRPAAEGDGVG